MVYNIWQCPRCKHFASDQDGLQMGHCTALKPYPILKEDSAWCGLFKSTDDCAMWVIGKISPAKLKTVLEGKE